GRPPPRRSTPSYGLRARVFALARAPTAGLTNCVNPTVCPGCGSTRFRPLPSPECGPFHLEACTGCGHVVTRPEPRESELTALYGQAYYGPGERRFVGPLELATSAFRRWRACDIARRRPPGTFLDIGCGSGLLAASIARRGWRAMGTELSDESARHAR